MSRTQILIMGALVGIGAVLSGLTSGVFTERWGTSTALLKAAELLENFPREIGDWKMIREQELDDLALLQLECVGYSSGEYVNQKTGQLVSVSLIAGPFGTISTHSPDICYPAAGFLRNQKSLRVLISNGTRQEEFWATSYKSKKLGAMPLSIYYAWSPRVHWSAPDWPRLAYGGSACLYKIQVVSNFDSSDQASDQDPCRNFLQDFLPEWDRYMGTTKSSKQ